MVKPQALELISSTAGDRDEKANAYVDAVATTTAELLKTSVTDDLNTQDRSGMSRILSPKPAPFSSWTISRPTAICCCTD